MRAVLPSPDQIKTIRQFLTDSCGWFIEGVEFGRPASGLSIKVQARDFYGHTHTKTMLCPDMHDFQDTVVLMSEWLDSLSGVAQQREQMRKFRAAGN